MKLKDILEAMMKRSNPYVSGDKDGPNPTSNPWDKKSAHSQKIEALAKKANVPVIKVSQIWDEERDKVDEKLAGRWALVMNNVKKRLGIS